jgi:CRP/FNR family transcriptional activator FtrB
VVVQDLIPCEKLKGCPLFSRLSVEDLEPLMGDAVLERHAAGAVFFRQGERAERFFVILKGRVVLYVGDGDTEQSIAGIVGPGQTFAEAAICGQGVYPMTAEALEPTEVVAIPGEPFCRLLEQRFDLVLSMLGEMSLRLRGLLRQIMDLKMKTTAQRLAAHLLGLTEAETGRAEIRLQYGKKLLASELGMQPETLSRAFLRLQPLGVRYHKADDVFRIRDVGALREFSESPKADG